jgi:hypothetical protein
MSKKNIDNFINQFSIGITTLKEYEFDLNLSYSKNHYELFNNLLNELLKKKSLDYIKIFGMNYI